MRVDVFCNSRVWKEWLQKCITEKTDVVRLHFGSITPRVALVNPDEQDKPKIVVVHPAPGQELNFAIAAIQQLRADHPDIPVIGIGTYGNFKHLRVVDRRYVAGTATPNEVAGLLLFYWLGTQNPA